LDIPHPVQKQDTNEGENQEKPDQMGIDIASLIMEVEQRQKTASPRICNSSISVYDVSFRSIPRWSIFMGSCVNVDGIGRISNELLVVLERGKYHHFLRYFRFCKFRFT
jgi:hypothetical protein